MYEKMLEDLVPSDHSDNAYEVSIKFQNRDVRVTVDPDDSSLELTMMLAERFMASLQEYELKAKKLLCDVYLDCYNEDWRDEEDGILSAAEFGQNLTLCSIDIYSSNCVDFYYEENGMFGRHSLIAQVDDGENFTEVNMWG